MSNDLPLRLAQAVEDSDCVGWLRAFTETFELLHQARLKTDPKYSGRIGLDTIKMLRESADKLEELKRYREEMLE